MQPLHAVVLAAVVVAVAAFATTELDDVSQALQPQMNLQASAQDVQALELLEDEEGVGEYEYDEENTLLQSEQDTQKAAGLSSSRRRRRRRPSESPSVSPSATPSVSFSNTPSWSASVSVSMHPSNSSSPSVSPMPSPPASVTPSVSVSPPPSDTATPSPSSTPTSSISVSQSPSMTISATVSFSPSMSVSQGATDSASTSYSPSFSISASVSISPDPSSDASASPDASESPSVSLSPTVSDTPTPSPSPSVSPIPLPPMPSRAVVAVEAQAEPFEPHPLERALYSDETKAEWSYDADKKNGPEHWGKLDESFKQCADEAGSQSPLDLYSFRIASPMSPLVTPQYKAGEVLLRNTGNYLRIIPHKGSVLFWGDKMFDLVYIQVHTPSEHHMAGETFPLELQFVHKAQEDDQMAVLSLLYKTGLANTFLDRVLETAPRNPREEAFVNGAINLGDAVPRDITQYQAGTRVAYPHYSYEGSLTTPPCRENVRYFVWSKPDHASKQQIEQLQRLVTAPSSRPLQEINGRVVEFKTLF